MKPKFEVLPAFHQHSFLLREFDKTAFDAPYHLHPEYELTLIVKGQGIRYIGSNMSMFADGDLVLLGSNLPHCWKLDNENPENMQAHCIVVQFPTAFLGDGFFAGNELAGIKSLMQKSSMGLGFKDSIRERASEKIKRLARTTDGFDRLMLLLDILHALSQSAGHEVFDQSKNAIGQSPAELKRINDVFTYLVENFRNDISLKEVSAMMNMTPNAFCKYFKKITRSTLMEKVLEYRLSYAKQQLVQTDKPISHICYDSGFKDISYFNKTFKAKTQFTPLNYRKRFLNQ